MQENLVSSASNIIFDLLQLYFGKVLHHFRPSIIQNPAGFVSPARLGSELTEGPKEEESGSDAIAMDLHLKLLVDLGLLG
ncbi:hypothetical protein COP2_033754 [Malus domestica]